MDLVHDLTVIGEDLLDLVLVVFHEVEEYSEIHL